MSKDIRETESLVVSETRAPNEPHKKPSDLCSRVRVGRSPYFEYKGAAEEHHPPVRLTSREKWTPPRSPFNLVQVCRQSQHSARISTNSNWRSFCISQENLFHNPWQLLVATIFLNRTGGERAIPLALAFLEDYPDPTTVLEAPVEDIAEFFKPIGLSNRRARTIKRFTCK